MDKEYETVNTTTRFAHGSGTEDITIDYFDEKRFEVRGKNIAGPLIIAMDASLDPEVPKGARLLVNLSGLELVGRVWKIQMLTEIDEFVVPANSGKLFNKDACKKVKLWFPIWTED